MSHADTQEIGASGATAAIGKRMRELETELSRLIQSPVIKFDARCRSALPELPGIYRIFDLARPGETIRAGRTTSAAGGLRQRVYQNHLMGDQPGNLRAQMVGGGECSDIEAAKQVIREKFGVQVLVIQDSVERASLEHFMLAVLRPRYSDKRGIGESGG
jgi:hypothetical protein